MPLYAFFVADWYKYMPYLFKRLYTAIFYLFLHSPETARESRYGLRCSLPWAIAFSNPILSAPFVFFVYILLHFRTAWYNIFATTVALSNRKQAFRHPCKSPAGIFQPGFCNSASGSRYSLRLLFEQYGVYSFYHRYAIIQWLPPPYWYRKGVSCLSPFISFIVAVAAAVAAHYVIKWLDSDG